RALQFAERVLGGRRQQTGQQNERGSRQVHERAQSARPAGVIQGKCRQRGSLAQEESNVGVGDLAIKLKAQNPKLKKKFKSQGPRSNPFALRLNFQPEAGFWS